MRPSDQIQFESEAALVSAFCSAVEKNNERSSKRPDWTHDWAIYPETAGFDLVLSCRRTGVQVGIEAKLSLNLKVIEQALEGADLEYREEGPDYRAVLVPKGPSVQKGIRSIANRLGLTVLTVHDSVVSWHGTHSPDWQSRPNLPNENGLYFELREWHPWLPIRRLKLPDYVPDVAAGVKSPVALTEWKIRAIKLMILLERHGRVTRGDMKALQISPTRWTDGYNGFLQANAESGGYVRCSRTPDFKAQHPRNYGEIEADFDAWCPPGYKIAAAESAA